VLLLITVSTVGPTAPRINEHIAKY